jgi:hypothetical protein
MGARPTGWGADRDNRPHPAAAGPDRPAPWWQPGDPGPAGVTGRPRCPADPRGQAEVADPFGYTLLVAEDERGFIGHHRLQQATLRTRRSWSRRSGTSWRSPACRPTSWSATAASAPPPTTRRWTPLGVKRVGRQRTGTPGKARLALEWTRAFHRLRSAGSGSRPGSATSSAALGLRRTRLRRLGGAAAGWGWGSSPTTCSAGRGSSHATGPAPTTNQYGSPPRSSGLLHGE